MADGTAPTAQHLTNVEITPRRRIIDGLTMLMVSVMSLLLLAYVGYGAAQQTYTRYFVVGATAQGEVVRNALESSLRNGLTLRQYVGFGTLVRPIVEAENGVTAMKVIDLAGRTIFEVDEHGSISTRDVLLAKGREMADAPGSVHLVRLPQQLALILPLHNRFEQVGDLVVSVPRAEIGGRIDAAFEPLIYCAVGLSVLFALSSAFLSQARRRSWLPVGYVIMFVGMAILVTGTMVVLYSEGTQAKTNAGAASLAQRLKDIIAFNLNFDQFEGIGDVFAEFKQLDPDVTAVGLIVNDMVQFHTSPGAIGRPWLPDGHHFEYIIDISNPATNANRVKVAVAVPRQVVVNEVAGSIKDFAALFIASGFFAGLFFHFVGVMSNRGLVPSGSTLEDQRLTRSLELARPLFFLAVFVEHLNYPFLPQYVLAMAQGTGEPTSFASAPFIAYYLSFALVLIPAGWVAQRLGPKHLISWGLLLAAAGLFALFASHQLALLTAARALAGVGQGMLFIGIQSYIVLNASAAKRTRGAAIIVFGFQGGMISGTAIGSLLVGYIDPGGVFLLSAALALTVLVYAIALLPAGITRSSPMDSSGGGGARLTADILRVLRPGDFLGTMLLVGIPAKAVMTGVILFGLPLLLTRRGFSNESIGQLIMLYALGVLATSEWISRIVDRTGFVKRALVSGTALSGLGLMIVGAMAESPRPGEQLADVILLMLGVGLVGIAHGLVNAPIVTCIAETQVARTIGVASATAAYRFLERLGHVLGPIIVARIFLVGGQAPVAIAWIGVGLVASAIAFLVLVGATKSTAPENVAP